MPAQTVIQPRRGTAASWASTNPVLNSGEVGLETDTGLLKFGDGTKVWKDLGYYTGRPFDMGNVKDDVPIEMNFNVDKISAPVGTRMNIPTHISNPGQTTHPSALFFPEGWGSPAKWKYWLAHTPYPGGNDDHEDPNIVVSNNGISWQVPAGVTNPLADATGQPEYHSDVELKMGPDDTMYLFYRWAASVDNGGTEEQFRYFKTKDGVNWVGPTTFHILDQDVLRIMSPSLIFEDGKWTMWGVDITSSPNRVIRRKSANSNVPASMAEWGAIDYPTHNALPAGKEPWHIFMMKHGGKYFGLLNTCDLDQNGANGELHFMQSYDGYTFESSAKTIVPMYQAGEHDQLYRSTMVPAVENGVHGFRLFYTGWTDAGPVWNLYRSFLRAGGTPYTTPDGTDAYTPLSPTNWTNRGSFVVKDIGSYKQFEIDIHLERSAGAPNLAMANTFVSCGLVIPTNIRAILNSALTSKYLQGWLAGAGFNLPVQVFINFYSGEIMMRQQSGTSVNIPAGVFLEIATGFNMPIDNFPV